MINNIFIYYMSFATCFQGIRGLPFFESEANVIGSQVLADSNGAAGLAGQCEVYSLVSVPTTGFNSINKSRPTLIRLSIAISTGATQIPLIFEGRIPPFVYDARIVCFTDADLITYAGNLKNCPNQQVIAVLGAPRCADILGNEGFNTTWSYQADTSENPSKDFAVYSANVLVSGDEHNISGGLYMIMNARDANAAGGSDELRSAFNIVPAKSAVDYVCI